MTNRALTPKSILFGLVGVLITTVFCAYSGNNVIRGYLPIIPLFIVFLLSFGWNSLVARSHPNMAFCRPELAVVFSLMLFTAWIPDVQDTMVRQLVLPRYEEVTTDPSWQEAGVTTRLPQRLFPQGADGEMIGQDTHFGMIQGDVKFKDVPFGAWVGPLLHWMPFVLVLITCLLAMTFMVHRQWTKHEQLRYPLAAVVDSLLVQDEKKGGGAIFRNRLFWIGCGFVFGLQLLRYLHAWFPSNLPAIPTEYSLGWGTLFPAIGQSNANHFLLAWMPISFAIIGIAYFVSTDVSFSMGIMAPLATIIAVQYYLITGKPVSTGSLDVFRAGGFLAFGLILTYTGRSYYFPLLRKAIWPGSGAKTDEGGVWAARAFLVAYVALVFIVASMGVDLLVAWILVSVILLVFLVVTRLVCETGVPVITGGWSMPTVLSGLFSPAALGAAPLMFMTLLSSTIISSGSTQLAMPYMATGLKLLDDSKVNTKRFVLFAKIAILVAMVAGFAAVLIITYSRGAGHVEPAERGVWEQGVKQVLSMMDFGQFEASEAASGLGRLALIRPDGATARMVLIGLFVVLGCYLLRFRFSKWPLHPLFFVVVGTQFGRFTWTCFLLGWVIKTLIVKVGGGRIYRDAKPLFVGFILGEFISIAMMLIVGLIWKLSTGDDAPTMWML